MKISKYIQVQIETGDEEVICDITQNQENKILTCEIIDNYICTREHLNRLQELISELKLFKWQDDKE